MKNEKSVAMTITSDYKKANLRLFIIILVCLTIIVAQYGYGEYIKKDIGTSAETIEISDIEKLDNSTIKIGDDIYKQNGDGKWEKLK